MKECLCLRYERQDLQTFTIVAYLNEWGVYLFTSHDYGRLAISASGTVRVALQNEGDLEQLQARLTQFGAAWQNTS